MEVSLKRYLDHSVSDEEISKQPPTKLAKLLSELRAFHEQQNSERNNAVLAAKWEAIPENEYDPSKSSNYPEIAQGQKSLQYCWDVDSKIFVLKPAGEIKFDNDKFLVWGRIGQVMESNDLIHRVKCLFGDVRNSSESMKSAFDVRMRHKHTGFHATFMDFKGCAELWPFKFHTAEDASSEEKQFQSDFLETINWLYIPARK